MEKAREEEKAYPIWIDHKEKIVSFKRAEGYEELHFSSQEEKIEFAIGKCAFGYRIQ